MSTIQSECATVAIATALAALGGIDAARTMGPAGTAMGSATMGGYGMGAGAWNGA